LTMSRKVLVAYDGSLLSRQAIQESKNQVSLVPGTEVHLVSVVNPTGPSTNVGLSNNIRNELAEKFEVQLKSIREEFEKDNIPVFTEVIFGNGNQNPGIHVCKYAEENEIDLIIVGSRGLGKVKNIFLGSVSNNIVHHAKCPILVIK